MVLFGYTLELTEKLQDQDKAVPCCVFSVPDSAIVNVLPCCAIVSPASVSLHVY